MKKFTLLLFLFVSAFSISQEIDYRKKYPNESVITLHLSRHIKIKEQNGVLQITEEVQKRNLFLSTDELRYAKDKISYDSFNQIVSVKATTENRNGTKVTKDQVTDFKNKNSLIQGIFFNDQKEKTFHFPNVQNNSITNLVYTKKVRDPHLLPSFIIASSIPIVKATLSITFPKNVEINYKSFHLDKEHTTFEKEESKKNSTYRWTLNEVDKINRNYDFSPLYYIPQIIPFVTSYTHGKEKIEVLGDPEKLYRWYRHLIKDINPSDQSTIKQITKTVIGDETDEIEKIKRIFAHVQENLNYIAFEDGLNGFIPRDAATIYKNRYGDCKDMSNVLNEMLGYAGIQSFLTWIGTRKKPYTYRSVPTPVTDNHMITTVVTQNKDTLFLDPTAKYIPFGIPSPFIQGKEAMIGISPTEFRIKKVPEITYKKNQTRIQSAFTIEENKLLGTHQVTLTGMDKLAFMHRLNGNDNEKPDFINRYLKIGTKQTSFEAIEYDNPGPVEDSIHISLQSKTPKYLKKVADKLFITPNFDAFLTKELIPVEQREFDKKNKHCFYKVLNTSITIPNDFSIDFIPESKEFTNDDFNFSISYETNNDNTILIKKRIAVKTLKVASDQVSSWNSFIKTILNSNKKSIVLSQKNP